MPGRTLNSPGTPNHRSGYQEKEYDAEMSLYSFDLRMYEPELGRWLSPNPLVCQRIIYSSLKIITKLLQKLSAYR